MEDESRCDRHRAQAVAHLLAARIWKVHSERRFWFIGGTDPDAYAKAKAAGRLNEIPSNHDPRFLPVIHPTLKTGVEALVVAERAWLSA